LGSIFTCTSHEPGEMGLFNVQEICACTSALGLGGKVTISHGFCLGGITERKAAEAAETMAGAGVALVTHGAGGLTMPPIEMLRAAGVLVFAGNDDIRDTWSPYGTGDLLERAAMIGWKADFRRDNQVEVAFDLVSAAGARALGIVDYGIAVGGAANLFTIAVKLTMFRGRTPQSTMVDRKGSAARLASYRDGALTTNKFAGKGHWETHPGDELIHILDGNATVEIVCDDGLPQSFALRAGMLAVIPQGT
jgi:cytosine/adenosine deaminase-related metal-dependent hydrolase